MSTALRLSTVLLCCAGVSACALGEKVKQITLSVMRAQDDVQDRHREFARAASDDGVRRAAQDVGQPWLAGRAQPLAREATMPLALRANVNTTLLFNGAAFDLAQLAPRITTATGIPVYVRPDAMLPLDAFAPRLASSAMLKVQAPATAPAISPSSGPEPLSKILDRIGARLGVMWRYQNARIEFYRTETRVFNIRALTLNANAEAALGSSRAGKTEGFVSTSKTTLSAGKHDLLEVVRLRIEPFLSQAGILVAESGASSSIVVTDIPEVLQRIALYLEQENRALTRRVRLIFDEVTLITRDSAEAGFDWNLVFSSAKIVAAASMPSASAAEVASAGIGLADGQFKGSEAVVKALSQVGQVVRRSSLPVLTLNRRPVSHAVRTTFSYIDRVETTALPSGAGTVLPAVSVSQKEETVGSLLTLVPDAQEDGQILLSVAYDNTVAQPLKSVTFGDKSNPLQLQQITIDGNGTVQQVALRPGQPLVISGFDRTHEETEGRRLNPGVPMALGGSDRASSQRLATVVVVTAQVEEGF